MDGREPVRFGAFELDRVAGRLFKNGVAVALRPKSFAVLDYLLAHRGELVRKEDLLETVWAGTAVSDTVLKVCIREIRKALDEGKTPRYIETAHRLGYRFRAASPSPSIPPSLTSFVGRERELGEIGRLLGEARLVTLTGPGGCGKTRLAAEAVRGLDVAGEVAWVDLASVVEAASVASAVASALDVREAPGRSVEELLDRSVASRKVTVVVDNCEHLVDSVASLVHRLLHASDHLRVLATSRESLRIDGEVAVDVPPLSIDESIRLFAARASAARADFALAKENARHVSELCGRLDGLPLAIELASARLKTLPLGELLTRIDDRFRWLDDGARCRVPRHRTLRAAMEWSFDLLAGREKTLLARLAVFSGGCTLTSAEAICGDDRAASGDVSNTLSHLVEKSLVRLDGNGRYQLLETVRQFGREKLEAAGEHVLLESRHIDHFLDFARENARHLNGPHRRSTVERVSTERGNLSAALTLSLTRGLCDRALGLAGALFWFWFHAGRWSEGRNWLARALAGAREASASRDVATCLLAAGILDWARGEENEARSSLERSRNLFRQLGDARGLGYALQFHGVTLLGSGEHDEAGREIDESIALFRRVGEDRFGLATSLASRGIVALAAALHEQARGYFEESIAIARESHDDWALALPLRNLGILAFREGQLDEARKLLRESLEVQSRLSERWFLSRSLEMLAAVLAVDGEHERAARLFGAGEALRDELGASVLRVYLNDYERGVSTLRGGLTPERLRALWTEGRAATLEDALALGLGR